jgi:uncharacterized repeat protein (TIGR01451 family)
MSVLVQAPAAQAAEAAVTLTPSATTVESNTQVTYTLSVVCSGLGTCEDTVVTFPTNAITGNGDNDDIGSWFGNSSCGFVTRTVGGGLVTYDYGDLDTGNQVCTFTVRAPEYTTLGGAVATLTPTVSGSTIPTVSGSPATLTIIADHNASFGKGSPDRVLPGAEFNFTLQFVCGANGEYTGDIGMSAIHIEDPLPSNFVYSGYTTRNGVPGSVTITQPVVGSAGGTFVYDDVTGATCGNPPLNISNVMVISIRGTIDGPVGTESCNTATAGWTYIDSVTGSATSPTACTTVVDIQTTAQKGVGTTTYGNAGQYSFPGGALPYTHPGDWDGSGRTVSFTLTAQTTPATNNAGVAYLMHDPLPCLDNLVGGVYLPNDVGVLCQHPAFIPVRITATGFTPVAGNAIVLHFTDGSTESVPFASGGWDIPTVTAGNGVAEIEIPAFAEEGANTGAIRFTIDGSAAETAAPGDVLRNTLSSEPHVVGQSDPLRDPQLSTTNVGVVELGDGAGDVGRTIIQPSLTSRYSGDCVEAVGLSSNTQGSQRNRFEITKAPSEAIYFDYLAPVGATVTNTTTKAFTFTSSTVAGQVFTSAAVTPQVVPDFEGTGRTLYRWVIPAGVIAIPGLYVMGASSMTVDLGAGCAGVYSNDMTLGYGAPIASCVFNNNVDSHSATPPMLPTQNDDLDANGSPIAGNFCGFSRALGVAAINPGYVLNKTVQGNLDSAPAEPGTNGRVSPEGGEATYTVSFQNTGESNLTDPVMYDLLPRVGDTIASGTTARDSDFAVELTGMGSLPAGLTVEYSTAVNPCRPEVLATNPDCADDWAATPPPDLGDTTALRFEYDGTVFVSGASGVHGFEVDYTVSTPPADDGEVAWNSVGSNALAGDDLMGAAESTLVGLEAADDPLVVTKSSSVPTFDAAGQAITFTYTVANGTAVPLTGVTVTDAFTDADPASAAPTTSCVSLSNPDASCSGASTSLQPGQVATFTATYTTTQADVDHGVLRDQATSSGLPPTGGMLEGTSAVVTVTAEQDPSLDLQKTSIPGQVDAAGQEVTYSFLVSNDGNVTIDGIDVIETVFTGTGVLGPVDCPATSLAPGDDVTCTAIYTVTQDDIDAGQVDNTAQATGVDPAGIAIPLPPSSTAIVDVLLAPAITLVKTADVGQVTKPGAVISYGFQVTNGGNTTLTGVHIDELAFTGTGTLGAIACPVTTLAPAQQTVCTASYTTTPGDFARATITNTAQAVATSGPSGDPITVTSAASVAAVAADLSRGDLAATGSGASRVADVLGSLLLAIGGMLLLLGYRRRRAGI